ncbi:MAG: hypothetical protein QJR01_05360 [Kyrpidia sp.]|nr:hypothetical protein [Kyrpidia sp.]
MSTGRGPGTGGAADLHAHLLPGVDDGPESLDDALALVEEMVRQGIEAAVCTPHMFDRRYRVSEEAARCAFTRLRKEVQRRGVRITLYLGAEVRLTEAALDGWTSGAVPRDWGGGRYVLVELPMQEVPRNWLELAHEFLVSGVTPILAHPERYPAMMDDGGLIEEWVDRGGLCQVTWGSLLGTWGSGARRRALWMLEQGLCHVMATDAHDLVKRPPDAQRVLGWIREQGGEETAEALLGNAWTVLLGNSVENLLKVSWLPRRRRWWRLWEG